ncbi:MAG: hypothetical protein U1D25_19490 [Hydrogenophaga sp.]|uniref:hypothetical protein n=1 Tax=Hydrogenophaga sp. TaxID=1904254 RepID=UPI00276BEAB3|nr:hypothetical protein [Hydrogenophaga sp.]MDP2417007.1 hypothetical protein [Hydrogenophaga sp.]MDZ4190273.1 hypothetical protein [Hydrogenophaga sp.]
MWLLKSCTQACEENQWGNKQAAATTAVDEMHTFMRSRKPVRSLDLKAHMDELGMRFVPEASMALLWLVPGTQPAGVACAEATLVALKNSPAVVPALCAL